MLLFAHPYFLAFISKTVNDQCHNPATTHTIPERSFRDLSGNVWVVALIVNRFRDKRQKHQHCRGDLHVTENDNFEYSIVSSIPQESKFDTDSKTRNGFIWTRFMSRILNF